MSACFATSANSAVNPDILVSVAATVTCKSDLPQPLRDIIRCIRSRDFAEVVTEIRSLTDSTRIKALKKSLPIFFPTIIFKYGNGNKIDEHSQPTGIVQFDIDQKDNGNLNFDELKAKIDQIAECIYSCRSPSGGLKFGILTDFTKLSDESAESMVGRFSQAYNHCLAHIKKAIAIDLNDDKTADRITQACFLSFDHDAYFNERPSIFHVNDDCVFQSKQYRIEDAQPSDEAAVQFALAKIPRNLDYKSRIETNYCVLYMLARAGIPLLLYHWDKPEKDELKEQLEDFLRYAKFGSIYQLRAIARKHGYTEPTGRQRTKLRPEAADIKLEPLVSPDDANTQLAVIISNFIETKNSQFINITAGSGKTRKVLEILLDKIDVRTKVLYLVQEHKLAMEIHENFKKMRSDRIPKSSNVNLQSIRLNSRLSRAGHLMGRDKLCENQALNEMYKNAGVSMHPLQCINDCPMFADCGYTTQFNNPHENIRIMTHREWDGEQSKWANGYKSGARGIEPRKDFWVPDYIVIDENIFSIPKNILSGSGDSKSPSFKRIIDDVNRGLTLPEAVLENSEQVLADAKMMHHEGYKIVFTDTQSYIDSVKPKSFHFQILKRLEDFLKKYDETLLNGMWVQDNEIKWLKINRAAERYENIPTLFLDATANQLVIDRLLPGVKFHSIAVKSNPDVNLYQLADTTFSKDFLMGQENFKVVASGLKAIVDSYKNVGLITYKGLKKDDESFSERLGEVIGIPSSRILHFGALRGKNQLEDVDCLLIVGRNMLPMNAGKNYARTIFNHAEGGDNRPYADMPVRMKDGSCYKLNSSTGEDEYHHAIYEHFSLSETLQAIGRGRAIYGSKKDIFFFSNENLGTDIEVAEFFLYEDYFDVPEKPAKPPRKIIAEDVLDALIERGFVRDIQREIEEQLMLTKSQVKDNRKRIYEELLSLGFEKISLMIKDKKSSKRQHDYYLIGDGRENLAKSLALVGKVIFE